MAERKHYYENADILRGFAILLVVLGHAVAKENIVTADSVWCSELYNFIYSFHMPLFFIISGFCFTRYAGYGKFLLRKCRYLLVPYFVFCFLTMITQRILPFFTLVENDFQQEIRQIFFYGGSIWFIYVLFEIMIIFPLAARIINGKIERAALLLAVSMGIYALWGKNIAFLCVAQMTYYTPYFLIGHMLRILNEKEKVSFLLECFRKMPAKLLLAAALLAADFVILYAENQISGIPYIPYLLRMLAALIGSFVSYLLVTAVSAKKVKYFLKQLGQYSLQIYLFNGYFIAVSRTLLFSVFHISDTIMLAAFNFTIGLAVNYIFCYSVLKIKFVKILCGKR